MINYEFFVIGLLIVSTLTGLVTEAIKKILTEHGIEYRANTLVGLVSVILSAAISIGYVIVTNSAFNSQIVVCLIAMMFLSWLCAMVGYDKVVQAINQFKMDGKDGN